MSASAPKLLPRSSWVAGLPRQPGAYMVTLELPNGVRTQAPCNYTAERICPWHEADARLIHASGAKVTAHFALPPAYGS